MLREFGWAASFGNTSYDRGHSLTLDSLGNVYTSGYFQGTTDFDPDTSVFNLTSFGGSDLFVSKLDSAGHFIWAIQIGGISSDGGNSIVVDDSGFIYVTGNFNDTADFDPKGGIFNMVSAGSNDIFVCKLDSVGNLVWAKQMGGTGTDIGTSVCLDPWGNVLVLATLVIPLILIRVLL
ncbi:MAG: SBBP repeat-containing protein [Bacteroidetes bacterium]|nr:SBBP repeat-containing protein [Bacteroidota bacterium]